ncbi:YphA family membrane protein [Bacillus massilinigeriensis]|uniref:YphA family membrane protein n=1 Tax=Bacillus mediterraneensis TaxID=1805474 RepID=UPI0008F94DBB|nr:hypothetical protein [Bacillus mediterraneensis]
MEGAVFYWFLWLWWVYTTFLMRKTAPHRLKLSAGILLVITCGKVYVKTPLFDVPLVGILLVFLITILTYPNHFWRMLRFAASSLILMSAYVSFRLIELYDPVWVLFGRTAMLSASGFLLVQILEHNLKSRIVVLIGGFLSGDILFAFLLSKHAIPYESMSLGFLDLIACASTLTVAWTGFCQMTQAISNSIQQRKRRQAIP